MWGFNRFEMSSGGLLIPDTSNTLIHVTATDLKRGVASRGPVWSPDGSLTLNAAAATFPQRPFLGPFSAGNDYNTSNTTQFASLGSNFTMVAIVVTHNTAAYQGLLNNAPAGFASGWDFEVHTSGALIMRSGGQAFVDAAIMSGTDAVHVCFAGIASGTTAWLQLDNNTASNSGATLTYVAPGAGSAFIGAGTIGPLTGSFYEAMISTDTPSAALFTSLYNSIISNGSHP